MKNNKILIIIPAYNEEKNIVHTYESIVQYNKKYSTNYSVIVINDGSKDKTKQVCEIHGIPFVSLIHNLGIGGAVQTGYKYAALHDFDIAVQYDGDGQHDVRYIKDITDPIINKEADFVIGSRFVNPELDTFKTTLGRRVGIKLISFFIKLVGGHKIFDTTSGFRACNKELIQRFAQYYPTEYPEPITTVEIMRDDYKILEIPAEMNERVEGVSSIHTWKNVYYMLNIISSILIISLRRKG